MSILTTTEEAPTRYNESPNANLSSVAEQSKDSFILLPIQVGDVNIFTPIDYGAPNNSFLAQLV